MRISENTMLQDYLDALADTRSRWFQWNRRVSTGKRLQTPSDNPSDSARLIRIREDVARVNQYIRNISTARSTLGTAASSLNTLRNTVIKVAERTGFAITDTTSDESRRAIALELRSILENMKQIASTSVDGKYIFSGSTVDTPPVADVGGTFVYQGDDRALTIQVSKGEQARVNVTGLDVFFEPSTDLLNTMRTLITQLETSDIAGATASLGTITESGKVIDRARFVISQGINQIDGAQSRHEDQLLELTSEISRIEDVDMAEAISKMVQSETALEATLRAGGRLQQGNLFDFIG